MGLHINWSLKIIQIVASILEYVQQCCMTLTSGDVTLLSSATPSHFHPSHFGRMKVNDHKFSVVDGKESIFSVGAPSFSKPSMFLVFIHQNCEEVGCIFLGDVGISIISHAFESNLTQLQIFWTSSHIPGKIH